MLVRSLGYLRWRSPDVSAWATFATQILGMMHARTDAGGGLYFRMDDEPYRLAVVPGAEPGIDALGFQVSDSAKLDEITVMLDRVGIAWSGGTEAECADRRVGELVRCDDPAGVPIEFYCAPITDHTRLVTPYVDGFIAGALGFGHVVLTTTDMAASAGFYRDVLGFQLRNTATLPSPNGAPSRTVQFYGCNPRHHSVALVEFKDPGILRHFMVEMTTLDDVGAAIDRCQDNGVTIRETLGRHTNDLMASFYVAAPDGTNVEIGFGAQQVDSSTWAVHEITAPSLWGHRPVPAPPPVPEVAAEPHRDPATAVRS
ncbi:VOC family protein [Amycolatopsis sp. GM8]|uniref:VOC family protein n=1 Tax=Amycolatopsis sp. GM8 TaxID=2896530 RepID=UPI001F21C71E|nr:VOC family protein [Amycolatopsis sp. GM8]